MCQANVIVHMLLVLFSVVRINKEAYALIEYDLAFEYLKYQIVAEFIFEHWIDNEHGLEARYVTYTQCKLYFVGRFAMNVNALVLCLFYPIMMFFRPLADQNTFELTIKLHIKLIH